MTRYRIDRHSYVPELWAGMIVTALYLWAESPVIADFNDTAEYVLAIMLTLGSSLCVLGTTLGSRYFFPRATRKASYLIELAGLPMIIVSLGWYSFLSTGVDPDHDHFLIQVLSAGLGVCIQIGSIRMVVDLVTELIDIRKRRRARGTSRV